MSSLDSLLFTTSASETASEEVAAVLDPRREEAFHTACRSLRRPWLTFDEFVGHVSSRSFPESTMASTERLSDKGVPGGSDDDDLDVGLDGGSYSHERKRCRRSTSSILTMPSDAMTSPTTPTGSKRLSSLSRLGDDATFPVLPYLAPLPMAAAFRLFYSMDTDRDGKVSWEDVVDAVCDAVAAQRAQRQMHSSTDQTMIEVTSGNSKTIRSFGALSWKGSRRFRRATDSTTFSGDGSGTIGGVGPSMADDTHRHSGAAATANISQVRSIAYDPRCRMYLAVGQRTPAGVQLLDAQFGVAASLDVHALLSRSSSIATLSAAAASNPSEDVKSHHPAGRPSTASTSRRQPAPSSGAVSSGFSMAASSHDVTGAAWLQMPSYSGIVTLHRDCFVRLWSVKEPRGTREHWAFDNEFSYACDAPQTAVFTFDRFAFTGSAEGDMHLWDFDRCLVVANRRIDEVHACSAIAAKRWVPGEWHKEQVTAITAAAGTGVETTGGGGSGARGKLPSAGSSCEWLLTTSLDASMALFDVNRQVVVRRSRQDKGILCLDSGVASSGSPVAITGGFELEVFVWDPFARSSSAPIAKLVEHRAPHRSAVVGVALVPGSNLVVSVDSSALLKTWDLRMGGKCVDTQDLEEGVAHPGGFCSLAYRHEDATVIVARRALHILQEAVQEVAEQCHPCGDCVGIGYCPDDHVIITAHGDGVVVWNIGDGTVRHGFPFIPPSPVAPLAADGSGEREKIRCFALDPFGSTYVVGTSRGRVVRYRARSGEVIADSGRVHDAEVTSLMHVSTESATAGPMTTAALLKGSDFDSPGGAASPVDHGERRRRGGGGPGGSSKGGRPFVELSIAMDGSTRVHASLGAPPGSAASGGDAHAQLPSVLPSAILGGSPVAGVSLKQSRVVLGTVEGQVMEVDLSTVLSKGTNAKLLLPPPSGNSSTHPFTQEATRPNRPNFLPVAGSANASIRAPSGPLRSMPSSLSAAAVQGRPNRDDDLFASINGAAGGSSHHHHADGAGNHPPPASVTCASLALAAADAVALIVGDSSGRIHVCNVRPWNVVTATALLAHSAHEQDACSVTDVRAVRRPNKAGTDMQHVVYCATSRGDVCSTIVEGALMRPAARPTATSRPAILSVLTRIRVSESGAALVGLAPMEAGLVAVATADCRAHIVDIETSSIVGSLCQARGKQGARWQGLREPPYDPRRLLATHDAAVSDVDDAAFRSQRQGRSLKVFRWVTRFIRALKTAAARTRLGRTPLKGSSGASFYLNRTRGSSVALRATIESVASLAPQLPTTDLELSTNADKAPRTPPPMVRTGRGGGGVASGDAMLTPPTHSAGVVVHEGLNPPPTVHAAAQRSPSSLLRVPAPPPQTSSSPGNSFHFGGGLVGGGGGVQLFAMLRNPSIPNLEATFGAVESDAGGTGSQHFTRRRQILRGRLSYGVPVPAGRVSSAGGEALRPWSARPTTTRRLTVQNQSPQEANREQQGVTGVELKTATDAASPRRSAEGSHKRTFSGGMSHGGAPESKFLSGSSGSAVASASAFLDASPVVGHAKGAPSSECSAREAPRIIEAARKKEEAQLRRERHLEEQEARFRHSISAQDRTKHLAIVDQLSAMAAAKKEALRQKDAERAQRLLGPPLPPHPISRRRPMHRHGDGDGPSMRVQQPLEDDL